MRLASTLLILALPLALCLPAACSDEPPTSTSAVGGEGGASGADGGIEQGGDESRGGDDARGGRGAQAGGATEIEGGRREHPSAAGGVDSAGGVGLSGGAGESPGGEGGDTNPPTPPTTVNGCTTFVDRTADNASRTLPWNEDLIYEPARCMQIRVGQSVTFAGDLDNHPMLPSGGDTPSPFGGAVATFTTPGTYGYRCIPHPSEMNGAVHVVP